MLRGRSQAVTRVRSSGQGGRRRTAGVGRAPLHPGQLPRGGDSSPAAGLWAEGAARGRREERREQDDLGRARREQVAQHPAAWLSPRARLAVGRLWLGGRHASRPSGYHAEASGVLRFTVPRFKMTLTQQEWAACDHGCLAGVFMRLPVGTCSGALVCPELRCPHCQTRARNWALGPPAVTCHGEAEA